MAQSTLFAAVTSEVDTATSIFLASLHYTISYRILFCFAVFICTPYNLQNLLSNHVHLLTIENPCNVAATPKQMRSRCVLLYTY